MEKTEREALDQLSACDEAVNWLESLGARTSFKMAWKKCTRPDWMLWLLGKKVKTDEDRRRLVLVACECARQALKFVPEGEGRPLAAIELAERWARGDSTVTRAQLHEAAAWSAEAAAWSAAWSAEAAAWSAAEAAAWSAAAAAAAAGAAAARSAAAEAEMNQICADIIRKHFPRAPALAGGGK